MADTGAPPEENMYKDGFHDERSLEPVDNSRFQASPWPWQLIAIAIGLVISVILFIMFLFSLLGPIPPPL